MVLQSKPVHPPSSSPRSASQRRGHAGATSPVKQPGGRADLLRRPTRDPLLAERADLARRDVRASAGSGIRVLLVFSAAVLIMVAAATLVGAVGQWWVLAPVMLVDFILTFIVLALFVELLGEGA